ncbi:PLP-dependent aminotransferase family protein [uncultured Paraglaciecola sp.]|uniref:aminotransferase-like domain-containing protein n=1 Tax=uncultured Paraglaciecola sp. TaxID=1765024 RepID=UPI0025EC6AD2|nr:PLP-dependent aminotransferase family protein [uncultured Paraglaciecola sp.]
MTTSTLRESNTYLYQQVINLITEMRVNGTLQAGQKLPSLRNLSNSLSVSIPTVKQAYIELERQGLVLAKPKSGYFLTQQNKSVQPKKARLPSKPIAVSRQQLIEDVFKSIHQTQNLPLGVANPVAVLPITKTLNRTMRRVMSVMGDKALFYGPVAGYEPLRRQLAFSYMEYALTLGPDDIIITNGAQEALNIALQSVAKAGDVIAVESPCYFGILELIENLGMLALEVPICPEDGLTVQDLQKAINIHPVKACVFSSTIANPMGCVLADDAKQQIVELLEKNDIPLIEDDVYGDLYFTEKRGTPAQKYSKKGLVITCSSFSKTAAPAYRIGWIATHKFSQKCVQIKRAMSSSSSHMNQITLFEFVRTGDYERYLSQLRSVLLTNKSRMRNKLQQLLGDNARISDPKGGAVLWLEFDKSINSAEVFQLALQQNISVSPGTLFSPSNRYQHCIRLSYGLPWDDRVEEGLNVFASICLKAKHNTNNL